MEFGEAKSYGPAIYYDMCWSADIACSPACPIEAMFGMTLPTNGRLLQLVKGDDELRRQGCQ